MKKKIISVLIAMAMILTFLPVTALADSEIPTFDTEIANVSALETLFSGGGSGKLTSDITLESNALTITATVPVNLNLNGYTLNLNEKYIKLSNNVPVFNLYDTSNGEGKITNGKGVKITGSTFGQFGGAIYIETGHFSMYGGTIQDCNVDFGGAVYIANGTFTMHDGVIQNCFADNDGGAVYVGQGSTSFIMNGGTIQNCTVNQEGGAVNCEKGTFHMFGGTITGNKARAGGGIYNGASMESFHMHGGTITGNKAIYYGGGIYSSGDCTFDGKCIVKENYSYQEDYQYTEKNKVRDNVFTLAPLKITDKDGAASVVEPGSEIYVTLAKGAPGLLLFVFPRIAGTIVEEVDNDQHSYFKSDVDAYTAEYDAANRKISLVSRINQQPTAENHYTVGVNTEGLEYTELQYQWMERAEGSRDLGSIDKNKVMAARGTVDFGNNTVSTSDGTIMIGFNFDVIKYTFSSTNKNITKSATGASLEHDGNGNYVLKNSDSLHVIISPGGAFSITDVKVWLNEKEFRDTDATLNGGVVGNDYFCRVIYKDGSTDDSEDVTVIQHNHDWTYTLAKTKTDNDTIQASCDAAGECVTTDNKVLTISAEDASYDGKAHGAALSAKTLAGIAEKDFPVIQYEKKTAESKYDKTTTEAPKEAGTYRASISVGEGENKVTAYAEYEIKEAITPAVTADFASFRIYLLIAGIALACIGYGIIRLGKRNE